MKQDCQCGIFFYEICDRDHSDIGGMGILMDFLVKFLGFLCVFFGFSVISW